MDQLEENLQSLKVRIETHVERLLVTHNGVDDAFRAPAITLPQRDEAHVRHRFVGQPTVEAAHVSTHGLFHWLRSRFGTR